MTREEKKRWFRLVYARTFRFFGIGLVLSAIVGGIYGDTMYAVRALCAAGSVLMCLGWFDFLKLDGMRIFGFGPKKEGTQVPYILRRFKQTRPHRPAFRKDAADFDDDLTAATAVDPGAFSEHQAGMASVWAKAGAGVLLYLVSFFI